MEHANGRLAAQGGDLPIKWAGARVVKASRDLTWPEKAVWLEVHGLADKSQDRCYLSAARLGQRLGLSGETVEKARRLLQRAGLLRSAPRPGRESSWWPVLPPNCYPPHARPDDGE